MLTEIHIQNFAIVDRLGLEMPDRMSVFTGETGAGKSILVEALGLLLGDRAHSVMVRAGCERAEISGVFDIRAVPRVSEMLARLDLSNDADECLVRRQISTDGRSRSFINDTPVSSKVIQQLGEHLVDIHGQHAHQSLLRQPIQRALLDDFAGDQALLERVAEHYRSWRDITAQIDALCTAEGDRDAQLDLLRYQVNELDSAGLDSAELDTLEQQHHRLANLTRIMDSCQQAQLSVSDSETNATSLINQALSELQKCLEFEPNLSTVIDMLGNAAIQLEEAGAELRHYVDTEELDATQLPIVEERLATLHALARKHHTRIEDLPDTLAMMQSSLHRLENSTQEVERLFAQQTELLAGYERAAAALSKQRVKYAKRLSAAVNTQLQELGMVGSRFEIKVEPANKAQTSAPPAAVGTDKVEFLISTNLGQPPQALGKIASGGELSRISLAIQVVTSQCKGVATLVFDEVDVGIGGRVAEVVGQKLRALGESRQVLCVTHQPQVAALGHHQFAVVKAARSKRTSVLVTRLDDNKRIDEIARMLGGIKITDQTRAHAAEMLGARSG